MMKGNNNTVSSVIVPMYNEEELITDVLEKNVHAFESSGMGLMEIIIVNDGSLDNSLEAVNNFKENYKGSVKIRIIDVGKNKGKSNAIKEGIRKAKGNYILLTDSDSYFDHDSISKILHECKGKACVVGFARAYETNLLSRLQSIEYEFEQKLIRATQRFYHSVISICGVIYVIRKDFINGIEFQDSIVEDFRIGIELNRKNKHIEISDSITYTHPPLTLRKLRKQRLRWFGGILKESLRHRDVWKGNGFYALNAFLCIASFLFILMSAGVFIAGMMLTHNKLNFLISSVIYFIAINFIISLVYLITAKRKSLLEFLVFPYYLLFLFVIRTEVVFKTLTGHKFTWGTRATNPDILPNTK
jgi:hyaluronan synthase